MWKKISVVLFLALLAVVGGIEFYKNKFSARASEPCRKCNIMLIDIDVLRADELPCYGYSRNTAPNICNLAKKSVVFKDNYALSNWTLPAMFSTVTSLLPTFHGVQNLFVDKLSPQVPTLAETLQREGYRTIWVRKDEADGFLSNDNGGLRGYSEVITNKSIDEVMTELSKSSQPWFVHYYWSDLHLPYLIPDGTKPMEKMAAPKNLAITNYDFDRQLNIYLKKHYSEVFQKIAIKKYPSIILGQDKPNDVKVTNLFNYFDNSPWRQAYLFDAWLPRYRTYLESFDQDNPADVAYVRMMYDTNIKLLDEKLGEIFGKLNSWQLADKTVTVLMSDHGEAFGEHGTFSHDIDFHSELYYTPLIIHSPKIDPVIINKTSSNLDVFPTILDLVGVKIPPGLQGYSLLPLVNYPKLNSDRFILSEVGVSGIILQNKNWLYYLPDEIINPTVYRSVLYDRVSDPQEKINVAAKYPEITSTFFEQAMLVRSYKANVKQEPKQDVVVNGTKLSPEKVKRMQKEGYF